jgi:hypothetical protein
MRQIFIDFEWQRDNKGYRLLDPELPAPPKTNIHPNFRFPVEESLLSRDWGTRCGRKHGALLAKMETDRSLTLNQTHTTGWAPTKFGISPISRKLSWGNSAANAKGGIFFGIFRDFVCASFHTFSSCLPSL